MSGPGPISPPSCTIRIEWSLSKLYKMICITRWEYRYLLTSNLIIYKNVLFLTISPNTKQYERNCIQCVSNTNLRSKTTRTRMSYG